MKPDTQLYDDIRKKLEFELAIDPSQITFYVQNGIATISGKVDNYTEKKLIQHAIWQIDGIKAVVDDIRVSSYRSKHSDAEIAASAVNALELDPSLPKDKIKVSVEKGNVTLSGIVPWYHQKQNAECAIRYLAGILNIDNQIIVTPHLSISSAYDVQEKIRRELEYHAFPDAQNISVKLSGSRIILEGQVQSFAQINRAALIAWSIPGVTNVENRIMIKNILCYNSL